MNAQQAKGGSDKVEDLLKPRRRVMADYPNSPFRIGDVLELIEDPIDKWHNVRTGKTHNIEADTYPAIFKEMFWYEEREASEMPEYVKYIHDGCIYKISNADEIRPFAIMFKHKYIEEWVYYLKCLPATEADYNQYIANNQK